MFLINAGRHVASWWRSLFHFEAPRTLQNQSHLRLHRARPRGCQRKSWTVFPLTTNRIWNIAASSSPVNQLTLPVARRRYSTLTRQKRGAKPSASLSTRPRSCQTRSANAAASWIFFPKAVTLHLPLTIQGGRGACLLLLNAGDTF